nr:MAG TPA: Putative amidase domain [Caudoviricetes sp.]
MWKTTKPGDILVFVESSVDDLHTYAWNLHVMSEAFYKKWEANE